MPALPTPALLQISAGLEAQECEMGPGSCLLSFTYVFGLQLNPTTAYIFLSFYGHLESIGAMSVTLHSALELSSLGCLITEIELLRFNGILWQSDYYPIFQF